MCLKSTTTRKAVSLAGTLPCKPRLQGGELHFSTLGQKGKSTSVLQTVTLQPGAGHQIIKARDQRNINTRLGWSNRVRPSSVAALIASL